MSYDIKKIVDALIYGDKSYIAKVQENLSQKEMAQVMREVRLECARQQKICADEEARKLGYEKNN